MRTWAQSGHDGRGNADHDPNRRGAANRAVHRHPGKAHRGARIDFNLGLLHKLLGRNDVALEYLRHGSEAARAQEASALMAKIDAAMEGM